MIEHTSVKTSLTCDCKRFITHQNLKLIFLSTCVTLCGVFMGLVPVAPSFPVLLLSKMSSLWQK